MSVDSAYATATGAASTVTNASTIELANACLPSTQFENVSEILGCQRNSKILASPKVEFNKNTTDKEGNNLKI